MPTATGSLGPSRGVPRGPRLFFGRPTKTTTIRWDSPSWISLVPCSRALAALAFVQLRRCRRRSLARAGDAGPRGHRHSDVEVRACARHTFDATHTPPCTRPMANSVRVRTLQADRGAQENDHRPQGRSCEARGCRCGADTCDVPRDLSTTRSNSPTGRDHARYDAYWSTMFASSGQDQPPRVAPSGAVWTCSCA